MNKFNLDISVINDNINCLNDLVSNADNMQQLEALGLAIKAAFDNNSKMYFTGIGKPGYVAEKQAASLKSIMIDAQFVDATLAGHGDLGPIPIDKPSMLIALSKSGCSSELYKLFACLKQMRPMCQVVLICMSNNEQFKTVRKCNDIDIPIRFMLNPRELDGYGIVPTTSNSLFEVILSTAISSAAEASFGLINICRRLKQSHPSGTLYNKVTKLLTAIDNHVTDLAGSFDKQD